MFINLNKKLDEFNKLCKDREYRDIDITKPYVETIDISNVTYDRMLVWCELYSSELDEYFSCAGGVFINKDLIDKFKRLDLKNQKSVLDYISYIESKVDWKKVSKELYDNVEKFKECIVGNVEDDKEYIVPAAKLGQGWNWHKYSDGSGHLESPDGKKYMKYDLDTYEYIPEGDRWTYFPLKYFFEDGVEPSEFKPFEYMEDEMLQILERNKKREEVNLQV